MEAKILQGLGFKNNGNGIWIKGYSEFWKSGFTGLYNYKPDKKDFLKAENVFKTFEEFVNKISHE